MNSRFFIGLGIGIALLTGGGTANADLGFSFQFDQSNYVVSPGGQVAVEVFLRQTGTPGAGETNVLGGSGAVGVTGTGVTITFPVGANDAQVLSASDISGNSAFDNAGFGPVTSVSGGSALLSQAVILGSPVLGTAVSGLTNTYDCFLGTFQFTAGLQAGQVTTIGASIPLSPHSSDNVAATSPEPTVLTNIESAAATITVQSVTAVPEPSSLRVVLGALASVLLVSLVCRPGTRVWARPGMISQD